MIIITPQSLVSWLHVVIPGTPKKTALKISKKIWVSSLSRGLGGLPDQAYTTVGTATVGGRNPVNSPVDMVNIPLLTGFYTSQCRISSINSMANQNIARCVPPCSGVKVQHWHRRSWKPFLAPVEKKNVKNLGANFAKVGGSAKSVSSRLPQSFSFLNLVDLEECSQKAPFPNLKRAVKKTRRISWIETLRSHCYSVRLMKWYLNQKKM